MGERRSAEQEKDQNNPHHDRLPLLSKATLLRGGTIFRIMFTGLRRKART